MTFVPVQILKYFWKKTLLPNDFVTVKIFKHFDLGWV